MTVFYTPRYVLHTDLTFDELNDFARVGCCMLCDERQERTIPELLEHLADHRDEMGEPPGVAHEIPAEGARGAAVSADEVARLISRTGPRRTDATQDHQ